MVFLLEAVILANGLLICAMTVGIMLEENLTVFELIMYVCEGGDVCVSPFGNIMRMSDGLFSLEWAARDAFPKRTVAL